MIIITLLNVRINLERFKTSAEPNLLRKGTNTKQNGLNADQATGLLLMHLPLVKHSLSGKVSWLGIHLLCLSLGAQANKQLAV
jgi:hypothetical protein